MTRATVVRGVLVTAAVVCMACRAETRAPDGGDILEVDGAPDGQGGDRPTDGGDLEPGDHRAGGDLRRGDGCVELACEGLNAAECGATYGCETRSGVCVDGSGNPYSAQGCRAHSLFPPGCGFFDICSLLVSCAVEPSSGHCCAFADDCVPDGWTYVSCDDSSCDGL